VWRSRALPPADLLRLACDRCDTYEDAKRVLGETPLCLPALCALADVRPGDGRIIERLPDGGGGMVRPSALAVSAQPEPKTAFRRATCVMPGCFSRRSIRTFGTLADRNSLASPRTTRAEPVVCSPMPLLALSAPHGCPRRTARTFVPTEERQSLITEAYSPGTESSNPVPSSGARVKG